MEGISFQCLCQCPQQSKISKTKAKAGQLTADVPEIKAQMPICPEAT